ncbi:MAG: outer membrane beta-barrel family protein [Sediminibacterium sp.]|nr:outer membrane beta-barrel family protein [Sediminibacterium sp.]MDP3128101.1 outer membrane beta-barrel family protein [Sediminibacterium sp.]
MTNFLYSQTILLLTGQIIDSQKKGIPNTTIRLTSLRKTNEYNIITNQNGFFSISLAGGNYSLHISAQGYNELTNIYDFKKDTALVLTLSEIFNILKGVSVKSKNKIIEQKVDRLVYNVNKSIIADGLTVWEILKRVPTVLMNPNNRISINGNNAQVMIDDKLLYLSNEDLESYLQGLSATEVMKIELIPIPPSKYGADGASLINIITNKAYSYGIKGIARVGISQAQYGKFNSGLDIFYKSKKVYFSSNINFRLAKSSTSEINDINYLNSLNKIYSIWNLNTNRTRLSSNPNFRINMEYEIDSVNTIGVLVTSFYNKNITGVRNTDTKVFDDQLKLDSLMRSNNYSTGYSLNGTLNLNYIRKFKLPNETLSIDLDLIKYRNEPTQVLENTVKDINNIIIHENQSDLHSTQNISVKSIKADYSKPIKNSYRTEIGGKYVTIVTINSLMFRNYLNGAYQIDTSNSNHFSYKEQTSAVYFALSKELKKISLKGGLRAEFTHTEAQSETLNTITNKLLLFPTLYINYRNEEYYSLNLSVSRRIERPEYWRLNPFKNQITPYYSSVGSPTLRSAFPLLLQLSFLLKDKYSFSFFSNFTKDLFTNISNQSNDKRKIEDIQVNLDKSISYGFTSFLPIEILNEKWNADLFIQFQKQIEESAYLENHFSYKNFSSYFSVTNRFTLSKKKKIKAEISGWYNSPLIQGIYKISGQFDLSYALRFPVLKEKGNISLLLSDILYSQKYDIKINYLNQNSSFYERRDTRFIGLTFTYKIGSKKTFENKEAKESGTEDEKRRIN